MGEGRVLVTGAEGFIGSHLVEGLVASGHSVRAMVLYNSFNSWGWLETIDSDVLDKVEVVLGDVRDSRCVVSAMHGVSTVFHLAALIAIPYSYEAPKSYIETNITGTLNVLEAARVLGTRRLLITSTSEVYGTAQYVPIDELHPRHGQSPYSASKIAADSLAESYHRSFEMPITIVRPFNTYGPRQSARAVIPTIITQLLSGAERIRLGSLEPTRDLVYVKDTVRGFLSIAGCASTIGHELNIATQEETSIGRLAHLLIDLINPAASVVLDEERVRPRDSEVERLLGSNGGIREMTQWKPEVNLETGLRATVDWFRKPEHFARYKPWLYNK